MPFGAELLDDGGVRFRLWAPAARRVDLCLEGPGPSACLAMARNDSGWFAVDAPHAVSGTRYRFRIDGSTLVPDPASRYQPEDVHGPSEVVDPGAFAWTDEGWMGRPWEETVIYELHVGAFTPAGTFEALIGRLDDLAELGITAIELMPVADTPGRRNWGYDGVDNFAPDSRYGRPEDLKRLVAAAHARGLMVFLDVVYNHFGPDGAYFDTYAPQFFTDRYKTPWGKAINFDGAQSRTVRDFFIHNALFWLEEYNIDGLRLDAVHAIWDTSHPHILKELAGAVLARVDDDRRVHLVLENGNNAARFLERDCAGRPTWYDAQWNDDIHHALHVLITGEDRGYYADYASDPVRHLGRCLTEGFSFQGQRSGFLGTGRGEPSAHLPATAFVSFLQNHDQIGNRAMGERITMIADDDAVKAAVAILLLAPSPPLLFMGEEWAAAQPFPFFCDFGPDLADKVRKGRRREFARFPEFRDPAARERIPDPNAETTFAGTVLNWADRQVAPHRDWLSFYRALLDLRHREIVPRLTGLVGDAATYTLIGERGLQARWRLGDDTRLTLTCNMGSERAEGFDPPDGRLLFATDTAGPTPLEDRTMPPWSTAWHGDF